MFEAGVSLRPLVDPRLLSLLRCPATGEPLRHDGGRLVSVSGRHAYSLDPYGIPLFAESFISPEAAAQKHHYDRISGVYLENLQYPHTREYAASMDQVLRDALGSSRLGVMAEVCCGQADAFSLAGEHIDMGVGVDVSLSMLAAARRRLPGPSLHFVQGDATRLPLADAAFDHVVMLGGVHHVPDREALFAQVSRVLKPGGRFIWREPVSDLALWRWMRNVVYRLSPTLDEETEHPLTYDGTVPLLERAGLSLRSWRTYGFLGYCLLMNSDVLVVNRALRFVPGISAIARGLARLDDWCLSSPRMARAGTMVVGVAQKPPARAGAAV